MSADTAIMPIPGPIDPVPVPRAAKPRADGRVERVERVKSIGHRSLDAAAIAAFRQWAFARRYAPWTLGIPIRYVDGPARIDEPMKRPAAPGCLPLLTMFSGAK